MILHAIGEERYEVAPAEGGLALSTTFEYSDRGMQRTTSAIMRMKSDYTPLSLEIKGRTERVMPFAFRMAPPRWRRTRERAPSPRPNSMLRSSGPRHSPCR